MPGQGRAVERPPAPGERAANPSLGATTYDVHIDDCALWRNVPAAVWRYKLGGYQALKKVAFVSGTPHPVADFLKSCGVSRRFSHCRGAMIGRRRFGLTAAAVPDARGVLQHARGRR